jgi:hypothetical protein
MMNFIARTGHYIRRGSKFGRCSKKSRHWWCRVCVYFVSNPFICSLAYPLFCVQFEVQLCKNFPCVSVGSADILIECLLDIY